MTAQGWASGIIKGTPVRWRGLETAAFEEHGKLLAMLDPKGEYGSPRGGRRVRLALLWQVPLGILLVALFVVPAWGFAFLMGDRFGRAENDPATAIHAAAVCYLVNIAFLSIIAAGWLARGRQRREHTMAGTQAGLTLVLGGISVALAASRGSRASVPDWPLWSIPIDIAAVLGGVFGVVIIIARWREPARDAAEVKRRRAAEDRAATGRRFRRIQEEIGRLPAAERVAVKRDIDAAIRDLVARGVVSAADGDRALEAGLGMLALHMSQRRKPSAGPSEIRG